MINLGEELVAAYLENIKGCEFIQQNLYTPDVQGEIDVVGIDLETKSIYVCEVAIHLTTGLRNNILGELRSRHQNVRLYIRFWSSNSQDDKSKAFPENIQKCIDDFKLIIEKNLYIFNEKQDLSKTVDSNHKPSALLNVSAEKYKGAEQLLSIAREFDKRPSRKLYKYNERLPLRSAGYIYLSASILFFVSLESFINTLYYLLLKDEFKDDLYKRFTKLDLDLRILSIHLFCKGFKKQPVIPGSDLWKKLITLRNFRNDVMHGNLTDDHHMYIIREQPYPFNFYYMPATDFCGFQKEKKHRTDFTRFQPDIDEEMLQSIQQTIDDVILAIISSMDASTKNWVRSWLREPFILQQ